MTGIGIGPGRAAQVLEQTGRRLARSDEARDRRLAACIAVILTQRGRLLTDKYGPERDFSRVAAGSDEATTGTPSPKILPKPAIDPAES